MAPTAVDVGGPRRPVAVGAATARVASHVLVAFLAVAVVAVVVPGFDEPWVSVAAHRPFVVALLVLGGGATYAVWQRLRDSPDSHTALLFLSFAALLGTYSPHALLESAPLDPGHLVFGPVSRMLFGLFLVASVARFRLPARLHAPRGIAVASVAFVLAVDVALHSSQFRAVLLADPGQLLRGVEWVALTGEVVAAVLLLRQLRVRGSAFLRALLVAVVAMATSSVLFLLASPWAVRWWVAHVGLVVAAAAVSGTIALERSRRGSLAQAVDLDAVSAIAELLLDETGHGLAVVDHTGQLVAWSAGATRLTGWTVAEARTGFPVTGLEGIVDLAGATVHARHVTFEQRGRPLHATFLADASEHVQLQQENDRLDRLAAELERAIIEKNELLGVVAHELRNPLGAVRGFAVLLNQRLGDRVDDTEQLMLSRVEASTVNMLELVDDLLSLSSLTGAGLQPQLRPRSVDLGHLVTESVALQRGMAEQKGMQFRVEVVGDCTATVDTGKLEQVVTNLVTNAVKFSPPGSRVEVFVHGAAETVQVAVRDHGQGIPADELEHLFEPFVRTSVRPTDGEQSTGLGLAIVQRIVHGHGGRISVSSVPEVGSTFTVTLPRRGVSVIEPSRPAVDRSVELSG